MKTKKVILTGLAFIAAISFSITSCKKESKTELAENNESVNDASTADASFNDADNVADNAARSGGTDIRTASSDQLTGACATVTNDTVNNKITIDFGSVNCVCRDGKNRRGKILVSYTGRYKESGSVHTITFDNYYVNDNKVDGTKTVTNKGLNANGMPYWEITANGSVKLADGSGTVTWSSTRTRTMTAGYGTATWIDDEYDITGTATGTSAKGINFTTTITTALHKKIDCKWFTSGVVEHTPDGKPKRIVDFGSGTCDDQATVTVEGQRRSKTYTITLRR